MSRLLFTPFVMCQILAVIHPARAQQVTIQQPVVSQFRVDTVVSVPDGGRVFLGSVGSAADARFQAGFSPIGSSIGREVSHQGADVSVFIHDLDELDRLTLAAGTTMENPWTGEITQGGPEFAQGAGLSLSYSYRPPGPDGVESEPGTSVGGFDPRRTAAFRALQSRTRD